jgi:hypothetical protein
MKKVCLALLIFFLFFFPLSVNAMELVKLEINEDIIPGKGEVSLTVTGVFSNGLKQQIREGLVWISSDTSIANVNGGGKVYFTGKRGSVTIAVYKGNVSGRKTVNVNPWPQNITIENGLYYSDNPYRLMAKGRFSDGTERYFGPEDQLVWFSSNPWVAWVNSQGIVTFTGEEGAVSIKAVVGEYSDSVSTMVDSKRESNVWCKGIKIKEEIEYAPEVRKLTLIAVMNDDSEKVIENDSADWVSSNNKVASIDNEGQIIFTGEPGFTTIKVSYGGYHYETLVKVGRFLEKVTINQSLKYTTAWDGISIPLSATAKYNDGSEMIQSSGLTWSVSDNKLASITEAGVLTFSGEAGTVTITVTGQGNEGESVEDSLTTVIPEAVKPLPKRLYINDNPISEKGCYSPQVICVYDNGERREIREQVIWSTSFSETASIYDGTIYFSPNPGKVELTAVFQGLKDSIAGYINRLPGYNTGRIYQLRIKEHSVLHSFTPVKLTGLAIMGDGSIREVTAQLKWRSSQPLVAQVNKGILIFSGRIGKTEITAQGFGFRDTLNIEVYPEDLKPRVDYLVLTGELSKKANQVKAFAYYNDGTIKDVTQEAVWNTSNKNVAVVTNQGNVMFIKELAPVTITAHYSGKGAEIKR